MLDGKIQLTAFKGAKIQTLEGEECVVIPIKQNHLFKDRWGRIWATLLAFPDKKLLPWTHNIVLSTPEKFRKERNWRVGAFKLEE